jgi:orotate phosphoribosyltransferase-like protein
MPLDPSTVAAALDPEIYNNLKEQFSSDVGQGSNYTGTADAQLQKIATAVAQAVAKVIVEQIKSNAQVLPGIATAGGPTAQVTVSPGLIS